MSNEQSIVKKTESAIDDMLDLWRRRRTVCVIVILIVLVPAGFAGYQQFFGVPKLKSEISQLQSTLEKAERERDKAQVQLAPFLAAADRSFPNQPPSQRLELLLSRLEKAIGSVTEAARKISRERVLNSQLTKNLISDLKTIEPLAVEITCILGDTEAFSLASQIKGAFEGAGWKVNGVNQAVFTGPAKDLSLSFGKTPSPQLQRALTPLFDSLGYTRSAGLDERLGEGNLKILV